jgi:hypothetical protein
MTESRKGLVAIRDSCHEIFYDYEKYLIHLKEHIRILK